MSWHQPGSPDIQRPRRRAWRGVATVAAVAASLFVLASQLMGWSMGWSFVAPGSAIATGRGARVVAQVAIGVVPLAGAYLVARGRDAVGAGVLVVAAATALSVTPTLLLAVGWFVLRDGAGLPWWMLATPIAQVGLLVIAPAAAIALTGRAAWSWRAPIDRRYVAAGTAVVIGNILPAVRVVPGGDDGGGTVGAWPLVLTPSGGAWATSGVVIHLLVLALVLTWAARAPRRQAAALAVALVVPLVVRHVSVAWAATRAEDLLVTPAGWLGLVGYLGLLALARRWWRVAGPGPG